MLKRDYDSVVHDYYKKYYGELIIPDEEESLFEEASNFFKNKIVPLAKDHFEELNKDQLKELKFIIANNYYLLADGKYPILEENLDTRRFVIIADTHYGSKKQNFRYIDRVIDFCIRTGITDIIHAGDFVEGTYCDDPYSNYENREDLVDELYQAIENYPKSSVKTHLILGNHDINSYNNSCNVVSNNKNNRYLQAFKNNDRNIVLDGVGLFKYNIISKNSKITPLYIEHYLYKKFRTEKYEGLVLHGHEHHYSADYSRNQLSDIYIPPLCDRIKDTSRISKSREVAKPGFILAEITGGNMQFTPYFFDNNLKLEKNEKIRVYRRV